MCGCKKKKTQAVQENSFGGEILEQAKQQIAVVKVKTGGTQNTFCTFCGRRKPCIHYPNG